MDVAKVKRRAGFWGVLVLIGALALSGCGASTFTSDSGSGGGASGGSSVSEPAVSPDMSGGSQAREIAEAETDTADSAASSATGEYEQRVIKTANLGISSDNVRETSSLAQILAERVGGTVMSSSIDRSNGQASAYLVLTVPSSEFEATMEELRGLGQSVTTDEVQGQDVTEEFVDLEARERNLLAAEDSLLKLYDEAQTGEATLAIQRELTTVRGQIEQVQGRIRYLEQRTDFSQISLSVQPVVGAPDAKPDWSPVEVAEEAWSASLALLQGLITALISLLVFSWWLVPVVLLAIYLWRRRRARRIPPAATPPTEA